MIGLPIPKCFDCRAVPPDTETNYTLISPQHGWRVRRIREGSSTRLEWRCPDCWRKYRDTGGQIR